MDEELIETLLDVSMNNSFKLKHKCLLNKLKLKGFVNRIYADNGVYKASLTPKGDKELRTRLLSTLSN